MKRAISIACLCASLCAAVITGQAPPQRPGPVIANSSAPSPGTVAYVYVSTSIGGTNRAEVHAFAAASDGKLSPVSGSPFDADVTFMAVNGLYLFGSDAAGTYIHAFSIDADGALRYAASTNVVQPGRACDSPGALFLDHTGATLYNVDYYGSDCASAAYQAFTVEKQTGDLVLLHETNAGVHGAMLRFSGDNRFAFGADCLKSRPAIHGYSRNREGSLDRAPGISPLPAAQPNLSWCPHLAAADPFNHVVVPMFPTAGSMEREGPYQLATYTIDAHGSLTTASAYDNMPAVAVGDLTDVYMSPSGQFVAVSGTRGLQVLRMNGAGPVTPYTGLLTKQEVDQMFWDNNNHLYAISQTSGKLWVFTVTAGGFSPAPRSPYSIPGILNIVVQPWPLPWK